MTAWKELASNVSYINKTNIRNRRNPVLLEIWYFGDTIHVSIGGSTNHELFADDCPGRKEPLEAVYEPDEEKALSEVRFVLKRQCGFCNAKSIVIEPSAAKAKSTQWDELSDRLRDAFNNISQLKKDDPELIYIVRYMVDGKVAVFFRNWANFKHTFRLEGQVYENEEEALIREEKRVISTELIVKDC